MDPTRARASPPNGARLRQSAMVQGPTEVVGYMGPRTAGGCPYGLGADCPLVEIPKRGLIVRRRWVMFSNAAAVAIGSGLAAAVVLMASQP